MSDVGPLLLYGIGLLVCHEGDRQFAGPARDSLGPKRLDPDARFAAAVAVSLNRTARRVSRITPRGARRTWPDDRSSVHRARRTKGET
jgi:hypothetical protein